MAFRTRRRRRRTPVVWLPNVGTSTLRNNGAAFTNVQENNAGVEAHFTHDPNNILIQEVPLVLDNPPEVGQTGTSLATLQDFSLNLTEDIGYSLRRVVGNFYISCQQFKLAEQTAIAPAWLVAMGLIVRRVDSETGEALAQFVDEDPASIQNNRDPWLFRRNWILGSFETQNSTTSALANAVSQFPSSNAYLGPGSVREGTFVDQKTRRWIGPEERLFMNLSFTALPMDVVYDNFGVTEFYWNFQYRILGTKRYNRGNRGNSTR